MHQELLQRLLADDDRQMPCILEEKFESQSVSLDLPSVPSHDDKIRVEPHAKVS